MKCLALLLLLPLTAYAAEHDHGAAQSASPVVEAQQANPTAVASPQHDHAAMQSAVPAPAVAPPLATAMHTSMLEHGGMLNWLLQVDRLEQQQRNGGDAWLWEAQGWYGGDYHKLWIKTEASWEAAQHEVDDSEVQLLYSRAVAPFWDLQAGLRHDTGSAASRSYAVLGVQGLAPYWFELDAAAFVSERGDLQVRLEAEYELRLTQKLMLQPRLQWNHAFADDKAAGIAQGVFASNVGLRLRYEFIRELAPYVGIERDIGSHQQPDATRVVAGIRFWY
jgi:copper resistance protein B